MPDIERDLSQDRIEYTIDIIKPDYTIDINPQNKFEIQLNEQGPQGYRGLTGNGIDSIELYTSEDLVDTYRINYTDGEQSYFTVTNGSDGVDGTSATIVNATASITGTTGTPDVTVTLGGTEFERVFNFAFSNLKGDKGDTGATGSTGATGTAATITVGSVSTGAAGTDASVINSGTSSAAVLDFVIPRGADGQGNVDSVNGQTGTVVLTATDVGALPSTTPIPDISNLADKDLSNLSSTGQGILDNKLNQQQTTNCIIEAPNKIKYTLSEGVLTLLEGSEVVVPYGTTDLSSTYPTGSTFINDNIQVVDTEYSDGKFFVRVKTLADITRGMQAGSSTLAPKMLTLQIKGDTVTILSYGGASGNVTVTSDSDAGNVLFYNKTTNNVKGKSSGAINYPVCSFPIFSAINNDTYYIASITNVFQCFGYIGTTLWCDKGVRCLISNGFNDDGSQNNTDVTTSSIQVMQFDTTSSTGNKFLYIQKPGTLAVTFKSYLTSSTVASNVDYCTIAGFHWDGTYIIGFGCLQALNTKYLIDGNVVTSALTLADSVTAPTSTPIIYDLTGYLPKDNYEYDVLVSAIAYTGATSGNFVRIGIYSDRIGSSCYLAQTQTRVNYQLGTCGTTWFPIGSGRKLVVAGNADNNGRFFLYLRGYRRRGINL